VQIEVIQMQTKTEDKEASQTQTRMIVIRIQPIEEIQTET